MLIDSFQNPPAANRPRPFWFFNGDLDKDEIHHQILEMKNKGLGGFFLCARQGLRIPYLSEEWFALCKFTVDTARENGLEVWLYDEYPYPSGMSGGEVTIRHPESKQKILELRVVDLDEGSALDESLGEGSVLLARAWPVKGESPDWENHTDLASLCGILQKQEIYQKTEGGPAYKHSVKRYFSYGPSKELRWKPESGKWRVLIAFTREISDFKYYGTFMDPANEDAVQCFIDTTYEPYKAALGGGFGGTVKGMFCDETGFLGRWPWSPRFPEYFKKKYGYSLTENLGALIDSSYPEAKRIRYNYFQCAHELLRDRYHKPISAWCEKNGISYVTEIPSVRMSNQMYSHVPAGDPCHDKLGYSFGDVIDRDFHFLRQNPKAISAMSRQFGRRDCLIESFHSIGWTATLQDQKWQIDRQTLMGITLHNFHAYYYTVNGITKHDAPPSYFIQNPYWEYYKNFADYCGRSSRFITETEAAVSTAILHPAIDWCTTLRNPFLHSNYAGREADEKEKSQILIDDYRYICKTMFYNQIDYEDLDPEVMAMGRIENGTIYIGRAKYTTLIVPPITCMEKYCFDLIKKFMEGGGKVIFAGLTPYEIIEEGFDPKEAFSAAGFGPLDRDEYFAAAGKARAIQKSGSLALLAAPGGLAASDAGESLAQLTRAFSPPRDEVLIPAGLNEGIIVQRRETENARFVMLASQNGKAADTRVLFRDCPVDAAFYELDLETGKTLAVDAEKTEGGCLVDAPLSPWSARIFAVSKPGEKVSSGLTPVRSWCARGKAESGAKTARFCLDLDKEIPVSIEGGNIYRLEELTVSISEGAAFKSKPLTFIEHFKIAPSLKAGQIKFGDGFGLPQSLSVNYPLEASYRLDFYIEEDFFSAARNDANSGIKLLRDKMGIMGDHSVLINGKELPAASWKSLRVYDQNNIAADITSCLKGGLNTITVSVTATEDWHGLSDPMYLLGNFGVFKKDGKFVIGKAPAAAVPCAGAVTGFPFYSGKFIYKTELEYSGGCESFTIELPEKYRRYDCAGISLNGNDLGVRAFSPYIWQGQAGMLKQGLNEVKLTLVNTLGNMFEGTYFDYEAYKTVFLQD